MHRRITFTLSLLAAVTVHAQSDFLGLPTIGYLDNISDSSAIQRKAPYMPMASMGAQADDERFWTKRRISLSYAYTDTGPDRNTGDARAHSGVPEIYLESRTGLALDLAGLYSDIQQDFSVSETDSDTFAFSLQAAQELWRFIRPGDSASQLWLGIGGGYGGTETDVTIPGGTAEAQSDTFIISPHLIFTRGLTEKLTVLIVPAYTMVWSSADARPEDIDSERGQFTLTGRGDYGVTDRITLTAFAMWKQDVRIDIDGVPSSALDRHSWAEFGGGIRIAITEDIGLRTGYSYDAFHPDFDRHRFFVRLELGF